MSANYDQYPYEEGVVVKSKCVITEGGGDTVPDRSLTKLGAGNAGYVHAEVGEFGVVDMIDCDVPTVYWLKKLTGTIVAHEEVEFWWAPMKVRCG